jgi:hypothetical protein
MPRQKQVFLLGIASGIVFMRANRFIHRGLKPADVLLDRAREPRIGDFGLSKVIERGATLSQSMQVGAPVHGLDRFDRPPFNKILWAAPAREGHFRAGLDVDRSRATRLAPTRRSCCRRLRCRPLSRRSCATAGRAAQPAGGRLRREFAGAVGNEARGCDGLQGSGQGLQSGGSQDQKAGDLAAARAPGGRDEAAPSPSKAGMACRDLHKRGWMVLKKYV